MQPSPTELCSRAMLKRTYLSAVVLLLGVLDGCARAPLKTPGPDVSGNITVWGQRRISQEVRIEEHRVWGPDDDDIVRFDDGYRGHSRFGQVSLGPCDGGRTCGTVGGAPTSFVVRKDEKGHLRAEGSWGPRKFELDLDENELKGTFGSERYFLTRAERPKLFYRGKTGYDPYYESAIQLPDKFLELVPEEATVYVLVALVR
jgi:hypothetical protein